MNKDWFPTVGFWVKVFEKMLQGIFFSLRIFFIVYTNHVLSNNHTKGRHAFQKSLYVDRSIIWILFINPPLDILCSILVTLYAVKRVIKYLILLLFNNTRCINDQIYLTICKNGSQIFKYFSFKYLAHLLKSICFLKVYYLKAPGSIQSQSEIELNSL